MIQLECPECGTRLAFVASELEPKPSGGDRSTGPKPEPTPLPPLRRLQAVDEANRTPKPDERLLIRVFPSASHDEKVLFICLTIALIIIMSLYVRGV